MPVPGLSEPWAVMETGRVGSVSSPQVGGWGPGRRPPIGPTVDPTGPHTRDAVSLKKKKKPGWKAQLQGWGSQKKLAQLTRLIQNQTLRGGSRFMEVEDPGDFAEL